MLGDGNLKEYLVYAFGEIILVVAGILIALQLNNLAQQKRDSRIEQQYLTTLQSQLEMDSAVIAGGSAFFSRVKTERDSITRMTADNKSDHAIEIPKYYSLQSRFNTKALVINELISTANINYLKSNELKHLLTAYSEEINRQHNFIEAGSARIESFTDYMMSTCPYHPNKYVIQLNNTSEDYFRHLLDHVNRSQNDNLRFFEIMKDINAEILQQIRIEIKTR